MVVLVGIVIFVLGYQDVARGLLLGGLFSVVNFVLMGTLLPYQVGIPRPKASAIAFASILGRFILLAVPVVVALKYDRFNVVGVIVGLFAVPVCIFLEKVLFSRLYQHT